MKGYFLFLLGVGVVEISMYEIDIRANQIDF